ncbi:uncharacterized protein IUM83_17493 [Phytophthora cinnamomi]|uniref:uncharacterized protein n=1 Tax=Phytophthora cinnamomi TaxID=4785 RepID=UPI00355AA6A2|nr:hypothetical protein IUM83_17493 [Phytophthora cinnamomi]
MIKTRAQRSSPPDDDAKPSSAPIVTPILPLRITSTAHAALVRWGKERREYEDTIHNRETDDLIVPIKNTFDEGLLRQWCRLQWKMSISDVTDDSILTKVDKIISTVKNNGVPDIDQEMAEHLRIDLSERDVHEKYFNLCHDIIDDHGQLEQHETDGDEGVMDGDDGEQHEPDGDEGVMDDDDGEQHETDGDEGVMDDDDGEQHETDGDEGVMDDDDGVPVSDFPPTDDDLREP